MKFIGIISFTASILSLFLGGYAVYETKRLETIKVKGDAINFYSFRTEISYEGAVKLIDTYLPEIINNAEKIDISKQLYELFYNEVEGPQLDEIRQLPYTSAGELYIKFTNGPDKEIVKKTVDEIEEVILQWAIKNKKQGISNINNLKIKIIPIIKKSRQISNDAFSKWLENQI